MDQVSKKKQLKEILSLNLLNNNKDIEMKIDGNNNVPESGVSTVKFNDFQNTLKTQRLGS